MAVLAVAGLIALMIAAITGSTPLAMVVVALAAAGIVQLVRDWRREDAASATVPPVQRSAASNTRLSPDEFAPDISTDPDGPSSDARADQT